VREIVAETSSVATAAFLQVHPQTRTYEQMERHRRLRDGIARRLPVAVPAPFVTRYKRLAAAELPLRSYWERAWAALWAYAKDMETLPPKVLVKYVLLLPSKSRNHRPPKRVRHCVCVLCLQDCGKTATVLEKKSAHCKTSWSNRINTPLSLGPR